MSADYQSREWIPWYCEDAASWVELSLNARGAAEGIARKMGRKRSELPLGSRGLRAIAALLQRPWEGEVEPAMRELLASGPNGEPPRLVFDAGRNVLIDNQAAERQRAVKSTERANRSKSKAAANTNDSPPESRNVPNVANIAEGGCNVPNVASPSLLFSSSESSKRSPSRSPRAGEWDLDSPLPDQFRSDAQAQIEPKGETVDVEHQWRLYLADRLRPEQIKRIGAADWRGWVVRAIAFAAKDRRSARGRPEPPGGASARARVLLTGSDD